jgi:hypothetical protein
MKLRQVPIAWAESVLYIDPLKIAAFEFCFSGQTWIAILGQQEPIKLNCTAAEFVAWLEGGAA